MSLHKELMSRMLPSKVLPPVQRRSQLSKGRNRQKEDFVPIHWNKYFTDRKEVDVSGNIFNVFTLGDTGPLLVLLHGGGYSGLTWALFAKEIYSMVHCQILSIDLRGHGKTKTADDEDLSAAVLAKDIGDVIATLYPDCPPVILMGHSMGGAVATHAVHMQCVHAQALIVIDVVEGTAVDALASMQSFLRSRPASFKTVQEAISWSIFSGQVKNIESAQVSVPGQIKNVETGILAAFEEFSTTVTSETDQVDMPRPAMLPETIEEHGVEFKVPVAKPKIGKYVWRIDLCKTEKYWRGWFQGLSNIFLSCSAQKLLLLANIDRLDRDLTVGQMQGKFAMHVLTKVGHAVHEDEPAQVAEIVANFMVRNRFSGGKENFRTFLPAC